MARSPADIIFRQELRHMAQVSSTVKLVTLCEGRGDEADWQGEVGRISLALLQQAVPDFQQLLLCS
ncbi:hypothetical protein ACFPAG_07715 [Vogesella sp. GCM10023246]|uniref:Oxidoreductase FAD/NAD(P)-binding domain-containing protein n=1 Tax=Vogesella oryzagri TaxID=3160864 RepID=A0ABV1M4H4_9NEIS